MKIRSFTRPVALILAAMTLSAAAAACNPAPLYDDYEVIDPGTLPENPLGEDYDPLAPYEETVKIKVLGINYERIGNVPAIYNGATSGPSNNAFNDVALNRLNIELEYTSILSSGNYDSRLSLLISGNELPDMFVVNNATMFAMLRDNGLIEDLGTAFWYLNDELKENFYLNELYYPGLETCMQEGKLYAFPSIDNPNEAAQKLYIRKDWLEIVGKEIPTTYEEVIDVAKAFRDNADAIASHSEGITGKDIIPIGITQELAAQGNNTASGFFNIFGTQPNAFFEEDGKIIDANTSDEMKEALEELHNLYEEGLLAREFYTYADAKVTKDIISGKVGIVSGMWHAASYPLQSSVNNAYTPDAEWVSIELPPRNGEASLPVVDSTRLGTYIVVRKGFEHPEAAAKLCNLFYDMFYSDDAQEKYGALATPEGGFFYSWVPIKLWYTPYSMDSYYRLNEVFDELWDAGFRIPDETLTAMCEENYDWQAWYEQVAGGEYGDIFNKLWIRERDNGFKYGYPYMQAVRNGKGTAEMNAVEKSGYGIYEQTINASGGYSYVAEISTGEKQSKRNVFYGERTPAQQVNGEWMDSYMDQYFLGVITGERSLSDWDKFVKEYNNNGGSEVLHQINQWYEARQSKGAQK